MFLCQEFSDKRSTIFEDSLPCSPSTVQSSETCSDNLVIGLVAVHHPPIEFCQSALATLANAAATAATTTTAGAGAGSASAASGLGSSESNSSSGLGGYTGVNEVSFSGQAGSSPGEAGSIRQSSVSSDSVALMASTPNSSCLAGFRIATAYFSWKKCGIEPLLALIIFFVWQTKRCQSFNCVNDDGPKTLASERGYNNSETICFQFSIWKNSEFLQQHFNVKFNLKGTA
ncbi:unnamed protein product [Protopolystoma xenopodis]|uniref:Uncharacterized protein n=1 Tax=Protopolystoma xenopodis TaxID=117903 RepID=A0A448WXE3_9PLAT|nr:unnamed protein product [Protopolystoma xenopodis]